MTPIEATVRIIETWTVTGKLSDTNVGETLELTERLFDMFTAQKPKSKRKTPEKAAETPQPTHVNMDDSPIVRSGEDW